MKTIFTSILTGGIFFLTLNCMSQPIRSFLNPASPRDINDLRDEKVKENLRSRIKHNQTSRIDSKIRVKDDLSAPDWNWAITVGGKGGAAASDIAFDVANNYYVIGTFNGSVNFGSQIKTSLGLWDCFIAKYNSSGDLIWVQQIPAGTNQSCNGVGISLDASNNIYITGHFNGTLTFGTSSIISSGGFDAFIARFDNGGNFIWAKKYGSLTNDEKVVGMATDPSGYSYIAGNAPGGQFLVKYNSDGQYLWETHTTAYVTDIAYGSSGIFLTGYIEGTTTFGSIMLTPPTNNYSAFVSLQDPSGVFSGANYVYSTDGESYGTSIVVDNSGNIFGAGWFYGTIYFPYANYFMLTNYDEPYFVAKFDLTGNCQWATQVTSNTYYGYADFQILPDKNGNVYAYGYYDNNFTFGTSSMTTPGNFIAKIDSAGNPKWAINRSFTANKSCISGNDKIVQTGAASYNVFLSSCDLSGSSEWTNLTTSDGGSGDCWYTISVDSTGNSYLHGRFSGTTNFLGDTVTGNGAYVAKISGDSVLRWIKTLNLASSNLTIDPSGIITDKTNNSYVWGTFSDSLNVEGTWITKRNPGGIMGYLVKYDNDGNFKWVRSFSCSGSLLGVGGIATDTSGNILIAGQYSGILTIGSYTFPSISSLYNSFFAKYTPNGDLLFAKTFSGSSSYSYWRIWTRSIACDKQNNILLTGQFYDTVNFGTTILKSLGGYDIFIAKYDPSGNELWAKTAGGANSSERGSAVTTDKNNNAYITGYFSGYGQSISFGGITIASPYPYGCNLYVAKYDPNGTALWARALQSPVYTWPLYKLGIDQIGNCYAGGDYYDTLKFDNGPILTGNGYCHFIAKYTPNGDFEWCQNLSGNPSNSTGLFSTAAVNDKTIYVAGYIANDAITFGAHTISSAGTNGFLALLGSEVGIPSVVLSHNGVELFPNPACQIINLEFDKQPGKFVNYSISDITGKILISNTTEGNKRITITLPDIPKGVYFIRIKTGIGEFIRKIVVD